MLSWVWIVSVIGLGFSRMQVACIVVLVAFLMAGITVTIQIGFRFSVLEFLPHRVNITV